MFSSVLLILLIIVTVAAATGVIVLLVTGNRNLANQDIEKTPEPLGKETAQNGLFRDDRIRSGFQDKLSDFQLRFQEAVATYPNRVQGTVESILWLVVLVSIADHLLSSASPTGQLIWFLTIFWHEMGHIICNPFGQFIMFAGGSIWQILAWVLIAAYYLLAYRRFKPALICWAIAGHSFINLARYIDDARARQLPLLFGLDSSHHDWWWLLSHLNLLEFDHLFAGIAVILGVAIILSAVVMGICAAWGLRPAFALPRKALSWQDIQNR